MLTSATAEEFIAFQTKYGYTVSSEASPLLALSLAFINTLPWCDSEQEDNEAIKQAQMFIAYAMSAEGGAFNPAARVDGLVVKSKSLGSLEKEFMFNDGVDQGSSSISLLKSLPIPYGLLSSLLCEVATVDSGTHRASVYVV